MFLFAFLGLIFLLPLNTQQEVHGLFAEKSYTGITLNLPLELRKRNFGGGSCVHASTINLLRWQGREDLANWWPYSGGESSTRLVKRMEAAGLKYAYVDNADFSFLEWCHRTRRGAGIFYKPNHALNFVGMDYEYVYLLDNNNVGYPENKGYYERVPIEQFKRSWKRRGGFAWTLVYSPPPPIPYL